MKSVTMMLVTFVILRCWWHFICMLVTFRSVTNIIICLVPNSIKIFSIFKQIPTLNYEIKSGFFVQKWRLLNSQKNIFWKLWGYIRKNGLDFLSRNDASSIPKIKILEFCWIFCPEMTLTQIPEFGFFFPEFTDRG